MKKTKLLASLVAASFLLAGAPAAITIPAGSDGAGSGTAADTGTSDLVSSTDDPNADSPAAADAGT